MLTTLQQTSDDQVLVASVEHADIDSDGVVHFAHYCSLAETAMLSYLNRYGITLASLHRAGYQLRVREIHIKYKKPAILGDQIGLRCRLTRLMAANIWLAIDLAQENSSRNSDKAIAAVSLNLVLVAAHTGRPILLPADLLGRFHSVKKADHEK